MGTYDPTPILSMETAIRFLKELMPGGIPALMQANQSLAHQARQLLLERLDVPPPAPIEMIASLVSIPIAPSGGQSKLPSGINLVQSRLVNEFQIEVPVFFGNDALILRTSSQAYNTIGEYERLADALVSILNTAS